MDRFDVLVVGGGAAGCVVAARLSAMTSGRILLLEAGPDLRESVPGPLRDGWHLARGSDWVEDWGYVAETDGRGEAEALRRGKLLGGTSWLTRFAVRGAPADFDAWGRLGNPGWSYAEVLPFFTQLEADADYGGDPWHGSDGPIPVSRYPGLAPTPIHAAALDAMQACGMPMIDDVNRPDAVGVGRMPMGSRDGRRVTTADAYLPIGKTPANLTVRADETVDHLLFDRLRVDGVRLADGSVIGADRVVLCAGTYGSPAILMRSGIGPAVHLRSLGIAVRIDLPGVGSNLADHAGVDVPLRWRGSARQTPILHSVATFHSSAARADVPDLMLWVSDPVGDPPTFSLDCVLLKPSSRGTLRLRSADPTDRPRIELPGLREQVDVDRLAEAYMRGYEIAGRPEVQRLGAQPAPLEQGGREGIRKMVLEDAYSIPHVVGTCAMGPATDHAAVVDAVGNVHGTEGLSVVDASIIPDAPSGFPHLAVIMIAERLSGIIATAS
jgi:choline dehydrogenase-like flavoprotein